MARRFTASVFQCLGREFNILKGWFTNYKNLPMMLVPTAHLFRLAMFVSAAGTATGVAEAVLNYGTFEAINELTDQRIDHRRRHDLTWHGYACRIPFLLLPPIMVLGGFSTFAAWEVLILHALTLLYFPVLSKYCFLKDAYGVVVGVYLNTRVPLAAALKVSGCDLGMDAPLPSLPGLDCICLIACSPMGMQDLDDLETDILEGRFTLPRMIGTSRARKLYACLFALMGFWSLAQDAQIRWQRWQPHPVDWMVGAAWLYIALAIYNRVRNSILLALFCYTLGMLCFPASLVDVKQLAAVCPSAS